MRRDAVYGWTRAQYEAAAAALGEEVRWIAELMHRTPHHAIQNEEAERIVVSLARKAGHYARRAMERAS